MSWKIDIFCDLEENQTMNAVILDSRRRLAMPPELPPGAAVTIQQIDADTWIVRRAHEHESDGLVIKPDIKKLPHDPEWEATETRIAAHCASNLPPLKE